jgi:formylglycine-generating enzyme required for sulfatase activity
MYCERCNIDFGEGLRYCKWCGETLHERRRVTSELYTCPACSSQVRQGWLFCKSCGARLDASATTQASLELDCPRCGSKTTTTSLTCTRCGEDLTKILDSKAVPEETAAKRSAGGCWACGETLEPNSLYCKSCGSAVYAGPEAPQPPQLLCSRCKSYSPVGSLNCVSCGNPLTASLGGQAPVASPDDRAAKQTVVDADRLSSTLPDLSEQLAKLRQEKAREEAQTVIVPAPEFDSGAHTFIFSTAEGGAPTETTDDLVSTANEAESPAAESETEAAWRRESAETNMLPGVAGSPSEQTSPTTTLKKTRITSPVEGETTATIGDDEIEDVAAKFAAPAPSPNLSPMPDPISDQPTVALEPEQPLPVAPPPPPPTRPVDRGSFREPVMPRSTAVSVPQPTGPKPQHPMPQRASQKSPLVLISLIVGLAVVAAAGFILWYSVSGGFKSPPAKPPDQVETTPANPPAPIPDQPPAPPPVPEGMVRVAGGTYTIGREGGDPLEQPSHQAEIKPFFIDRTEVTNADYKKFIDATGHPAPLPWKDGSYPAGDDRLPVTEVTWQDAQEYAEWAGKRLPTEAEWEAAARGHDKRIYPWGNVWHAGIANIGLKPGKIEEVGKYPDSASPVGALDMIGNVWEWTADEITLYPGSHAEIRTDSGVAYRVIRGGAFDGDKTHDACYRGYLDASKPYPKVGFRCVKDAK